MEENIKLQGRVEKVEGKKATVRFEIPKDYEGHRFFIKPQINGREEEGPYLIEYFLGSDYFMFGGDFGNTDLGRGYSHLKIKKGFSLEINLQYKLPGEQSIKDMKIEFVEDDEVLRKVCVTSEETKMGYATKLADEQVVKILNHLCFTKGVPIRTNKVVVSKVADGSTSQECRVIPYSNRVIEDKDLAIPSVPKEVFPLSSVYREAQNSSLPNYRLLCLYRIREGLDKLKKKNSKTVIARGCSPARPPKLLESNDITKKYYPNFIGKKIGAFLDHVRSNFRVNIAHTIEESGELQMDPSEMKAIQVADYTNAILLKIMKEMIQDEWDFMKDNGL